MRGIDTMPQFLPAQEVDTRSQQELFSLRLPSRSQTNCTFTRLDLSTKISSPPGPTTTAVCTPCTTGRGVRRVGRKGTDASMHSKSFSYDTSLCSPAA